MSDALAQDTPVPEPAAEAPGSQPAVESESAGAVATVPADRFNGLMSKYQSDKAEWDSKLASMQAELQTLRDKQETIQPVDNSELEAKLEQVTSMLLEERAGSAREKALAKYPEAAPFADMIVGDSAEEVMGVAAAIAERVKSIVPATATDVPVAEPEVPATEPEAEVEPPMPEFGAGASGGAAFSPESQALVDAKEEAIQKGDFDGFLNAAWALQQSVETVG